MDLSVIIVNYNVKEFIQNLIQSIYKAASSITYEIIIVDNASTDGSVEFLREKFPEIKIIANKSNLGFSKANNQGLKIAKGEYLILLNPDTLVREDTFTTMIDFFRNNPQAGLTGCKILNPDGTLQLACRRSFPGPWTSFCKVTGLSSLFPNSRLFARYNLTYLDENQTYEVDAISGSFMMFRREVYEKIGGLDEQFFMYGEDLDFCYRVQKSGYKIYYVHTTQIIHYKGESTKRSSLDENRIFYNAMHLFVKKHLSTSFLVELILQIAIFFTRIFAFLGKRKLIVFPVLVDFLLFVTSLYFSEKLYGFFREWHGFPASTYMIVFIIPPFLHIITASLTGVYKKNTISVFKNIVAIVYSFILLSSLTFFFKEYAYSRGALILAYFILFFVLTFWRIVVKALYKVGVKHESYSHKRSLIVGTIDQFHIISEKLKGNHLDVRQIAGYIGLDFKEIGKKINDITVLGSIENIDKIIRSEKVNEVIFASGDMTYNEMMSVVSKCQNENAEFKLIGNDLDFIVGKSSVSILNETPLIELNYNISNPVKRAVKRSFDVILSLLVLFLIYPFIYLLNKLNTQRNDFREFILRVPLVLKGSYSFVGPYENEFLDNLYLGKKGLTGLWYIENIVGDTSGKLNIYYARNQNIWFDLEIISRSLAKMWEKK